jgi:type I restriction enzyme M protein
VQEIRDAKHDLSINRYKEVVYAEPDYDRPALILERLKGLEVSIAKDLDELASMLG